MNRRVNRMILILHSRVIYYVHCLTKRNIWAKFHENRPKDSGAIERT